MKSAFPDPSVRHLWELTAVAAAVALWSLYQLFRHLRRDRLVADTPLVHLRSAAQGYVRVRGRAVSASAAPTAAPLSGRPCLWWSYEISVRERDARGNSTWRSLERATSVDLFMLREGEASCLVGPVNAEIVPTRDDLWYGDEPRPPGPPPPTRPWFVAGSYRYREQLLEAGVELCVLGDLRAHSEFGDRNAALAAKLRAWKQDQRHLLARFDADHDGHIDAREWETARAAAQRETEGELLALPIARASVIAEPLNGEPFLIAPAEGIDLAGRERRYAAGYFALGLVGVVLCAWALQRALNGPA